MTGKDLLTGFTEIDEAYLDQTQPVAAKKKKTVSWHRWISVAAVVCMIFAVLWPLWNAPLAVQADDLMEGISPQQVDTIDLTAGRASVLDFSARLMKNADKAGENSLISPISALYALSMTANGAGGDTLTEMESVLGMTVEELNLWLYSYGKSLNTDQLKLANSVWFAAQGGFQVDQIFLQKNADYYGADLYRAPFDRTTAQDINRWVDHKTNGMIPKMLEDVEGKLMVLVNALCFEAEWAEAYEAFDIRPDLFTLEDGSKQTADYLWSVEDRFLQDENAKGFVKYYEDERYAFLAMLPNEGITVEQYLDSLTGEKLQNLLDSALFVSVKAAIPKFETEFSVELTQPLQQMGMQLAFDPGLADFSGMGSFEGGNLVIDQVLQKTYICVDENGTKAAASTVGIMAPTSAPVTRVEQVILDRPFVYMLVDMQYGLPVFIGTVMNPAQ